MSPPAQIRCILVRAPNWVGDAVHALPAMAALRAHFPSAEITVLARGAVGALFQHHPSVNRVVSYGASGRHAWGSLLEAAGRLREETYDLGILLTNAFEGAWLMFLAGIPRRYGYARDGRGWLLTDRQACPPETRRLHQADYYLTLLRGLGVTASRGQPRLEPTADERRQAAERLRAAGWNGAQPLIALCPGAGYGEAKRWPLDRYAELAARLTRDGSVVLALGGGAEQPLGRQLAARVGAGFIDLTGRTDLREAMAVLSLCRLAVSNDSGLLHVAAAVGTPTIGIFGPTNPDRTGPTGDRTTIVRRPVYCSPCELRYCPIDHRCMEWVSVETVREATVAALAAAPSPVVFLDRDGTLNRDVGYLSDPDQLELLPGAGSAVRLLNEAGFRIVIVTNQSGLARGFITEPQLHEIHRRLTAQLQAAGASVDAIVYCPHHPEAQCDCRKPGRGLVEQAQRQFPIDCRRSYVVGDKLVDVQLARLIGAKGVLVRTGHGAGTLQAWPAGEGDPDYVADDLSGAAQWIVRQRAGASAEPAPTPSGQEAQPA